MKVTYKNHMGSDNSVVDAARVSFAKTHDNFDNEKNEKLINYLGKHKHEIPFAHTAITLHVQAPIFIRTQCFKHKVGFVENEVSRRYVDSDPEFFLPKEWRLKADNKKQGSSDIGIEDNNKIDNLIANYNTVAKELYNNLLSDNICPEQARMVLPQSMLTEWIWTGSLLAFIRFYNLRSDSHAQKEIQDLAGMVKDIIEPLYPISWKALTTLNKGE